MNTVSTTVAFVDTPTTSETPFILAILTTKSKKGKVKGNFENFKDLIATGTAMGFIVYVLPISHLNTTKEQLKGLIYNAHTDKWISTLMPFPNLIYNRIPYRQDEASKYVKNKIGRISKLKNVKLFNPTFFNKWQLFRWLMKSSETSKFLPETKRLQTEITLRQMLEKYSFLYLKPESGKAGKGIMTVTVDNSQILPYALSIQKNKESKTIRCSHFESLWKKITQESQNTPYIAQQGIKLNQYNGRSYDLRLLVQKNQIGKWEVSGMGARLAGQQSITTHVPRGGKIESPVKLLQNSFGQREATVIKQKVEDVAILLATQIEQESQALLAEMSMDVGVDKSGEIWFFEANSKPMKFDEPHIRKKSLQRIFQYGQFLIRN